MSQRSLLLASQCTMVLLLMGLPGLQSAAFSEMLLDPAFKTHQRPGVPFDHDTHMNRADCTGCHHSYQNGHNIWTDDQETRCSTCHRSDETSRLGLRQAWHKECLPCHEKTARSTAPTTCGGCHQLTLKGGAS